MNEKKERSYTKEQTIVIVTEVINHTRTSNLSHQLKSIDKDYIKATTELKKGVDEVHDIIRLNRGSKCGMHGFIGESAQVHISNADLLVRGEKAHYKLIDDNGPTDYLRDKTLIQQKAYQSSGMYGLDQAVRHANKYPFFVNSGGIYQIPKDFYDHYITLLKTPKSVAGLLRNEDYKMWKKVRDFTRENPDIIVEPMVVTYDEIQAGSIDKTLKQVGLEHKSIHSDRGREAIHFYRATIKEGVIASAYSGLIEGGFDGFISFIDKVQQVDKFEDIGIDDIKEVGETMALGVARGALRGAIVYAATNSIRVSAPVASAVTTATFDISEEITKYREGEVTKKEVVVNSLDDCIDIAVSATTARLGSKCITKLLPVKYKVYGNILGAIIGSKIGTTLYSQAKYGVIKLIDNNKVKLRNETPNVK